MTESELSDGQDHGQGLCPEDLDALRRSTLDVTDVPPPLQGQTEVRFNRAYRIAGRLLDGSLDPLAT
jgi:hypothetical protein